jgi:gliding motility-associated-like protein
VSITVNVHYDATIDSTGPFCPSDPPLTLIAGSAGGVWSGTGITDANLGIFNPGTAGPGTHLITYTISAACGDTGYMNIVVSPADNATINAAGPFCDTDGPQTLTAATSGGTWSGTGITSASAGTFSPAAAGVGSHTITYMTNGSCPDTATLNIVVNTMANATINPAGPFCANVSPYTLTAATSGGTWSGAGITDVNAGVFSPAVAGAGTHDVIYTIAGNCGDDDTIQIVVNPSLTVTGVVVSESCKDQADGSIDITVSGGTAPFTYLWSNTATTEDISALAPDNYTVIVTDSKGCSDTKNWDVLASIDLCYLPVVYVPNIFTPNGDNINDILYVHGQGIKEFTFVVYDRWGEKIFTSSDLTSGWDGTYKGKDMYSAAYVYTLSVTFVDGTETSKKGSITLTR